MIDLNVKLRRKEDELLSSPVGDEIMMMNVKTGDYLSFNPVATSIWNMLSEPISGKEICNQLLAEYEIDEKNCTDKTISFLTMLKEDNLLELDD